MIINSKLKNIILLHICIFIYTLSIVISKFTSQFKFLSPEYIMGFTVMIIILGVYAVFWQQIIKRFSASVAYSNKSVTTLWTMFFSATLFSERITLNNLIGAAIIILGVILVAQDE